MSKPLVAAVLVSAAAIAALGVVGRALGGNSASSGTPSGSGSASAGWVRQEGKGVTSRISGRVIARSDVQTLADAPLAGVQVLAVSAESLRSLLIVAGLTEGAAESPGLLTLSVPDAPRDRYVAASSTSQPSGEYAIEIAPGIQFICLGRLDRGDPSPGTHISGCLQVDVPAESQLRMDLFWGEAGLTAS
jgi:hypothetical protein